MPTKASTHKGRGARTSQGVLAKPTRHSQRLTKLNTDGATQDVGPTLSVKRALTPTSSKAASQALKRNKTAKETSVLVEGQGVPVKLESDTRSMASTERYILRAETLVSSDDESDTPLALTIPGARAPTTGAPEGPRSFIPDVHDPQAPAESPETGSDDDDLEEKEELAAEQTESEDELLTSLENDGDALGKRLAMEAPQWSQPQTVAQSKTRGEVAAAAKGAGLVSNARIMLERPKFKTPAAPSGAKGKTVAHHPANVEHQYVPLPLSVPLVHWPGKPNLVLDDQSDFDPTPSSDMYNVIFPTHGGQLSLKLQHPDIQDMLRASNQRLECDLVTRDAFPDARNRGRSVRLAMVETVKALEPRAKYEQLTRRMVTDGTFTRALSAIPNQRISSFRGKVKERSDATVASGYGLVSGRSSDKVNWLLPELIYVYPCDFESKSISEAKPYQHPVVASVVREAFFKGPKSFASRHPDVFASSLPSRDEREIPAAMLALVGTAIHASLVDWKSGEFLNASNFSADRYLDAYNEHVTLLKAIKTGSPLKYHTMMHKLYDVISGVVGPAQIGIQAASSAVSRLNIDAMEVD